MGLKGRRTVQQEEQLKKKTFINNEGKAKKKGERRTKSSIQGGEIQPNITRRDSFGFRWKQSTEGGGASNDTTVRTTRAQQKCNDSCRVTPAEKENSFSSATRGEYCTGADAGSEAELEPNITGRPDTWVERTEYPVCSEEHGEEQPEGVSERRYHVRTRTNGALVARKTGKSFPARAVEKEKEQLGHTCKESDHDMSRTNRPSAVVGKGKIVPARAEEDRGDEMEERRKGRNDVK